MGTTEFDPVLVQVLARRLEVVCEEAAITLNRTSGSPIVTEANDFSTSLMSVDGELIAFSSYLAPHFVSATNAIRDLLRTVDLTTVRPGDHFAANDPTTAQPLHSADPSVITPIFADGELAAWAYSSVHVLDIGGLTPGGWIPGSYDRFGEGFVFPLTKIVSEGTWDAQFVRLYLANVRMPESLNDLRSCVAANNTAAARLADVYQRYGAELVRAYAAENIALSEGLARQRIAALPDGVYSSKDWVDYDGHGQEWVRPMSVTVTVRGDELLVDLSDSPPEANCFVNTTRAGLLGWVFGALVRSLFYDLPINAGLHRPLRVLRSAPGTMYNPGPHAATSAGHMEAGTKVLRAFHGALHKAIGLSEEPGVRRRVAGLGANVAPHNVLSGVDSSGAPKMWVSFDSLGTGLGAQVTDDGRDCGCYEDMTGARMLDTELEETESAVHFYRRLRPNSGGHGFRRGGLGVDSAWQLHDMAFAQLTVFSNNTRVPSRAPGGGYPGGSTGNRVYRGGVGAGTVTEISVRLRAPEMEAEGELMPSHATNLPLDLADIVRSFGAGGSGLGDPLFREPWRVLKDLENAVITPDVVETVYGVVTGANGDVDEDATTALRASHRALRLGREPTRRPEPMLEYRPPLRVTGDRLVCNHCGQDLAVASGNWKAGAHARSWPLAERAAQVRSAVRPTTVIDLLMWEYCCPACGTLLEVDIAEADDEAPHDIRLGATNDAEGEPF
ncbi:MAG TPA: hydantoinase B/oxoprolinase family protein [Pseudonocardia sp.]|nr:hydantoinase B/oxoprolinase family protein [Pseudonocardia sp.]